MSNLRNGNGDSTIRVFPAMVLRGVKGALIGPFFYINSQLISHTCPLETGRIQADKVDNSYVHDRLYDDNFKTGDYIDYPRGRVIWDMTNSRAIIYIDRCIERPEVITKIVKAFNLNSYVIEYDDHYRCPNCVRATYK